MIEQLFPNPPVGNFVTVDLDVWIEYFLRKREEIPEDEKPGITIGYIREQIIELEAKIDRPISAQYRRSSNGHVHLRLIFPHGIPVSDAWLLRQCLLDDQTRLHLDMRRFALWGSLHELNKCFDSKADNGKITYAGPWIPLEKDLDQLTGDAKEDYDRHWDSIGRQPHQPERHKDLVLGHWKELSQKTKRELLVFLTKDAETEQTTILAE